MSYNNLETELKVTYPSGPKRRIAEKCLEKGKEWVELKREVKDCNINDRKRLKLECYKYIKDNVDVNEERKVVGSIIFMIIFGAIISWLVQRLLDNLFSEDKND